LQVKRVLAIAVNLPISKFERRNFAVEIGTAESRTKEEVGWRYIPSNFFAFFFTRYR